MRLGDGRSNANSTSAQRPARLRLLLWYHKPLAATMTFMSDENIIEPAARLQRRGRPALGTSPKIPIGLRLAADVVKGIRATGAGYNARVERVLREALANGFL